MPNGYLVQENNNFTKKKPLKMNQLAARIAAKQRKLHAIVDFVVDVREDQDQVVMYVMPFKGVSVPVVMDADLPTSWQVIKKKSKIFV